MNFKYLSNGIRKKWFKKSIQTSILTSKNIMTILLVSILLGSVFLNSMMYVLAENNQPDDNHPQEMNILEKENESVNEPRDKRDEEMNVPLEDALMEPSSELDEKASVKEKSEISEEPKSNNESTEDLSSSEFNEEQTEQDKESTVKEETSNTEDESIPTPEITQEENEIIASGNHGTDWQIYKEGEETILQIFPGKLNDFGSEASIPWLDYLSSITKVIVGIDSDDGSGKVIAPRNAMYLFSGLTNATEIIGMKNLDTSNVVLMQSMFNDSTSLIALDLSSWDTSKVENMGWMFRDASGLKELNVDGWNTSKVTNMQSMFQGASQLLTLDLSGFDTSSVTNMRYMFYETSRLTALNLDGWNTSNVTTMQSMFRKMESLSSLDLNDWDVRNVQTMQDMFHESTGFTSLLLYNWNLTSVKNLSYMFKDTNLKALDLSGWDTSSVSDNTAMFTGASSLNKLTLGKHTTFDMRVFLPPISTQGTYTGRWVLQESLNSQNGLITFGSSLSFMTNYDGTHPGTYRWEPKEYPSVLVKYLDTEGNELSDNETIRGFIGDQYVTEPKKIDGWKVTEIPENEKGTFIKGEQTVVYIYEREIQLWGTVPWTYDEETEIITLDGGEAGAVSEAPWKTHVDVKEIHLLEEVILPRDSSKMFIDLENLTHIHRADLFDTSRVVDMFMMFHQTRKLIELDVSTWDTSNVQGAAYMFYSASSLQVLDVSDWDTSSLVSAPYMFANTRGLEELDVSNWDVSNVTDMSYMLSGTGLQKIDLSNWDTTKKPRMNGLFNLSFFRSIKLGEFSIFNRTVSLPVIPSSEKFTSRWVLEESLNSETGKITFSDSIMFMDRYDGTHPGTYIWEQTQTSSVLIKYVDTKGKELVSSEVIEGYVGRSYSTQPKEIEHYKVSEIPVNASGVFMENQTEVTYVYEVIPVSPVDPLNPEKGIDPSNKPDIPEEQGLLSIDFASQFNFGTQMISTQKKKYYAQPQRLLDAEGMVIEDEERPNYVQISDRRSESERIGWQLSVRQKGNFKGEKENQVLRGAELRLMNQQVISAQEGEAPTLRNSGIVSLIPGGVAQPLLTAREEAGRGTWVYRFGDHENADKSIVLDVPAGANPEATSYSTTLSWELSSVPDNDF